MPRHKEQGRGRDRTHGQRSSNKRPKKSSGGRRDAKDPEPSAAFLAALEAQRASQQATVTATPPAATPPPMPGFYYDAELKKYFRGKAPKKPDVVVAPAIAPSSAARRHGVRSNWASYLAARQLRSQWTTHERDLLGLFARSTAVVHSVPAPYYHIADLAVANDTLALASVHGDISIGALTATALKPKLEIEANVRFHLTRLKWRSNLCADAIGYTALGGAGVPGFLRICHRGSALFSTPLQDAWTLTWHPHTPLHVAVGATHGYLYAHPHHFRQSAFFVCSPSTVASDVFAQSFLRSGQALLNGTRSGVVWLWDLRASRMGLQMEVDGPASVHDLVVLGDDVSFIAAAGNGVIARHDLRSLRPEPVVRYSAKTTMRPSATRISLDATETIVCGQPHGHGVYLWDVSSGSPLATVFTTTPGQQLLHGAVLDSATRGWRVLAARASRDGILSSQLLSATFAAP
ncbi:hypothetical protein ACHHYP_00139 [Achlya hypogyna]|uniref:Uncharacterized protein n=1 Tax=Achlya hypogyna TaxID=1202772 RepID=A0A1V9ZBB5_ACHHY|nr:hypothetical protein ACHHYP_00139 [Achlya hypogyna]